MPDIIEVTCEVKISPKCQLAHTIWASNFILNKKRNNDIYRCKACAVYLNMINGNLLRSKIDVNFFENITTELQAYMLGVIAGDGNIKDNTIRIVAHTTDIETLELFQKHICNYANIIPYKDSNCAYISFTSWKLSKNICEWLQVKSGKKSHLITIPQLEPELTWHFIRGLMDTDGSISNIITNKCSFPRCSYASISEKIKEQIKLLCKNNNINYTCDKISIVFNGINAINFMNKIYNNSTVSLSRKKYLYELAKTWTSQKGCPLRPRKIRKDKGIKTGHKYMSEEGRKAVIESNKRRRKSKI